MILCAPCNKIQSGDGRVANIGGFPAERLEALPETQLCLRCSEAVGGDFEMFGTWENSAKSGSLKGNYGGVKITKRRRHITPLK